MGLPVSGLSRMSLDRDNAVFLKKSYERSSAETLVTRLGDEELGGAEGNRTLDLLNAIQALSQLSYGPTRGMQGGKYEAFSAANRHGTP